MLTLHRSCAVLRIVDEKRADVMTVRGQRQRCEGVGRVQLRRLSGDWRLLSSSWESTASQLYAA